MNLRARLEEFYFRWFHVLSLILAIAGLVPLIVIAMFRRPRSGEHP